MARGDFMGDIVSASATSHVAVQPASGDEWVLKAWGSDTNWTNYRLHVTDGTQYPRIGTSQEMMMTYNGMAGITVPIDNSTYISFYNGGSGTTYFYYGAYKTKE